MLVTILLNAWLDWRIVGIMVGKLLRIVENAAFIFIFTIKRRSDASPVLR
jgi:hypothetical protein